MNIQVGRSQLFAVTGDIVQIKCDAIVNAANSSLLGGGGVDGAIHRAAGPELLKECELLGGCPTGSAKLTHGYSLAASWIIHTVGPVWSGGGQNEAQLLASCYVNSLRIVVDKNLKSVAFPCISTGIYGYPKSDAAQIAFDSVVEFLKSSDLELDVTFCCFSEGDLRVYQEIFEKWKNS